jgi:hypothetical protein
MAFNPNTPRDARGRFISATAAAAMLADVGVYAKDIEGWIAGSEAVRWAKEAKAAEVRDYWKSIAPVWGDKPPKKENPDPFPEEAYRDSIEVKRDGGNVAVGTDLKGLAVWLEYGSEHNPEYGYGARVLEHFGGGSVDSASKISDTLYVG